MNIGNDITSVYTFDDISYKLQTNNISDLCIGDYFLLDNNTWRFASFDWFYDSCKQHHIVIIPDNNLLEDKMNDTNNTEDGYINSYCYTQIIPILKEKIKNIFNNHILQYTINDIEYYVNLMTENQVFGTTGFDDNDDGQFPLFQLYKEYIFLDKPYWLSTIAGKSHYAEVVGNNVVNRSHATKIHGMRPYFLFY